MATSARATLLYLPFLAFLLLCANLALSRDDSDDPKLKQCLQECEEQQHYDVGMRRRCEQKCREQQGQRRQQEEELSATDVDTERQLEQCRRHCQQPGGRTQRKERLQCERRCEERYARREEGEEGEEGSPYVFDRRSFEHRVRSEEGHVKVLKQFHKQSKLLSGIKNYRVAILEANPRSFVIPNHADADCLCYVVQGRGTVATIEKDEEEAHEIREGDIFVTPAGAVTYLVNSDGREKLVVAKIVRTISVPGKFEHFFGPGGRNPESFYRSFSDEVLEAAFNTPRDRLERIFGKQGKGIIIRASEEQVRALSRRASEGGRGPHWPFGESSRGPFNLLRSRPKCSNRHGRLYEADADDYSKLADLDIRVSLANISAGSMVAPFYNTRSTKIAVVVEGSGHVEIVCPHLGRSRGRWGEGEEEEGGQEEEERKGYQTVRAPLSRGTVYVVPPGHPAVTVASHDGNLQIICFETCAEKNEKIYLAGRNNVMKKLAREAKELAFRASAREVDEVLDAQHDEGFLAGPDESRGQRHRGREEEEEGRRGRRGGDVLESVVAAAAGL